MAAKASAALAGSEYTDLQALPGSGGAMACTGDGRLHLFGLQVGWKFTLSGSFMPALSPAVPR